MSALIYEKLPLVSAEIARAGVSKGRKNEQQNYMFRGIDEVMSSVAPILARHGVSILPMYADREVAERPTKSGGVQFCVSLVGTFRFMATDGSEVTVRTYGEAMDSGDKATNKAMAAALKYALTQGLMIPVKGADDADAHTPEESVPSASVASRRPINDRTTTPANYTVTAPVAAPRAIPTAENVSDVFAEEEYVGPANGALRVQAVTSTPTKNPNVTKFTIILSDGREVTTIKQQLASLAEQVCQDGDPVTVETKTTKWGEDVVALRRVSTVGAETTFNSGMDAESF